MEKDGGGGKEGKGNDGKEGRGRSCACSNTPAAAAAATVEDDDDDEDGELGCEDSAACLCALPSPVSPSSSATVEPKVFIGARPSV